METLFSWAGSQIPSLQIRRTDYNISFKTFRKKIFVGECFASLWSRDRRRGRAAVKEFVSPKQVAQAIGVSESSLKRWCDRGLLAMVKTGGGHRRIAVSDVVRFVRETKQLLHDPKALGLDLELGEALKGEPTVEKCRDPFIEALKGGDEKRVISLAMECYLAGNSLAELGDQLIAPAFHEIGDAWSCEHLQVYEERRACEICLRLIHQWRELLGRPEESVPLAIGGTIEGDFYQIATSMAELTLRESGWRAENLGSGIPFHSLRTAILQQEPRLVWLSISHIADVNAFRQGMNDLWGTCDERGVALLIGGRAFTETWRKELRYSCHAESFSHTRNFAIALLKGAGGN